MKTLLFLLLLSSGIFPLAAHEKTALAREDSATTVAQLLKKPLTLPNAVRVALLNNRTLQATFEDIGLSEADLLEARSLANPQLDLAVKFPDRSPSGAMSEWGIVQNFLDLLLTPLRTAVAREQLATTQARVDDAVVETVSEVKIAYLQIQADAQIAEKLAIIRDAQRASLEFSQKLHAAGNITDLALLREQVAYSDTLLALAQAAAESRRHRESLNRLLSLWGGQTDWRIEAALADVPNRLPSVASLESIAVAHRSDLAASRSELNAAWQAAGLEKKYRFVGGLGLGLTGEHDSDGTTLNGPSLSLALPIFNQGQSKIARSQARLRKAERQFEGLAIDIRSNVRELRDQLISEADIARYYRDQALPNRQKILQALLLNYNAMLIGAFELFAARREIVEVERSLIEATRDYWITQARLERTLGGDSFRTAQSDK
jgi:outer membrane protein, heavy metal efflux system